MEPRPSSTQLRLCVPKRKCLLVATSYTNDTLYGLIGAVKSFSRGIRARCDRWVVARRFRRDYLCIFLVLLERRFYGLAVSSLRRLSCLCFLTHALQ
jgi:hypothetical protein